MVTVPGSGAIVAHVKEVDLAIQDLSANVSMAITAEGRERKRVFRLQMRREGVNYRPSSPCRSHRKWKAHSSS